MSAKTSAIAPQEFITLVPSGVTGPVAHNNPRANRKFSNRRRFSPWLITETLDDGLSYPLDLPAVIESEHELSTKDNEKA